jgi:hypothetical protein
MLTYADVCEAALKSIKHEKHDVHKVLKLLRTELDAVVC